jgi:hypothetical protein
MQLPEDTETAYKEMAADEDREQEALAWSEGLIGDASDELLAKSLQID